MRETCLLPQTASWGCQEQRRRHLLLPPWRRRLHPRRGRSSLTMLRPRETPRCRQTPDHVLRDERLQVSHRSTLRARAPHMARSGPGFDREPGKREPTAAAEAAAAGHAVRGRRRLGRLTCNTAPTLQMGGPCASRRTAWARAQRHPTWQIDAVGVLRAGALGAAALGAGAGAAAAALGASLQGPSPQKSRPSPLRSSRGPRTSQEGDGKPTLHPLAKTGC